MKDPLKQGLKLRGDVMKKEVTLVEVKDPLKQGLKPQDSRNMNNWGVLLK
mgnify:CR=1 FL=1